MGSVGVSPQNGAPRHCPAAKKLFKEGVLCFWVWGEVAPGWWDKTAQASGETVRGVPERAPVAGTRPPTALFEPVGEVHWPRVRPVGGCGVVLLANGIWGAGADHPRSPREKPLHQTGPVSPRHTKDMAVSGK